MANSVLHRADTRGHANHGWLDTYHSFSFASWYDPERIHFGALRVLNDDHVKAGYGFGKHPHDNMEIVTLVLSGALEHQDSMGHTEAIRSDEVQVMSAGSGVTHSEYNHSKSEDVRFLQIWIFPDKQNVSPRYDQRRFDPAGRINQLQMLVSPIHTEDEGLKIHQQAWIYRTTLSADRQINLSPHSTQHGFYVFVLEGSVDTKAGLLSRRDALGISPTEELNLQAKAEGTDILILEVPV